MYLGHKRATKTMKEFVLDCVQYYNANEGYGYAERRNRYKIQNKRVSFIYFFIYLFSLLSGYNSQ